MKCALLLAIALSTLLAAQGRCQAPDLLGVWGSSGDAPGQFTHPVGLALDSDGDLYVTDLVNHRIQVLNSSGAFQRQWGTYGFDASSITGPKGLAVDAHGHVFVAEWTKSDVQTQSGFQVFTTEGTYLSSWGSIECGSTCSPFGVAVGPDGRVYVTDTGLQRLLVFGEDGNYITQWPIGGGDVAVDASNNVYVATGGGVRRFSSSGAVLGSWGSAGTGPGQFSSPCGVAVDAAGNVYVADTFNNRVQVFRSSGEFVTEWGTYGSDPRQFYRPMGIAVGRDGRVYVADTYNDRIQVFGAVPTAAEATTWGHMKTMYR